VLWTLIGLLLVALSLSRRWALGVVGSLIAVCGLWVVAAAVAGRRANTNS
jgi:hypothetical protein